MQTESTYRDGYGSGFDNTQQEPRRQPFLIESEAVEAWRAGLRRLGRLPAAADITVFIIGYQDGVEAAQLDRARKPWRTEDEAVADFMATGVALQVA